MTPLLMVASLIVVLTAAVLMSLVSIHAMPAERFRGARSLAILRGFDPGSDARGLKLLREWLTPAQLACYERNAYFEVVGSDSAKLYRIHHGTQTNVEQLDGSGRHVCGWCFIPEGSLVAGDVMLAQKIALETNESQALAVAVKCAVVGVYVRI